MEKTFKEYCNQHGYKYDIHWRVEKDEWGYCKVAQMCKLHIMFLGEKCQEKDKRIKELEALLQESCSQHQDAILSVDKGIKALIGARGRIEELEAQIKQAIDILKDYDEDATVEALEILRGEKKCLK